MEVIRIKDINIADITYSEQRSFGEHAKMAYVNYKGKPIVLQTPVMTTPFGLSKFDDNSSGRSKYSVDMSFRGKEENAKINELYQFLNLLDDKLVSDASQRGQEWFKKKNRSKELCKELFASSVKPAMEKGELTDKYASTFKAKVPFYDEKFVMPVFDMVSKEIIDSSSLPDVLTKGSSVQGLVKLNGIWFAGGKFGVSWEVKQIKVKQMNTLSNYAFADDSDDETDEKDVVHDEETKDDVNNVMDSEDEEDL
jgi:hypothetical protein